MRLAVHHRTTYHFDGPVVHALQRLRFTPKSTSGQTVLDWTMSYEGAHEELSYDDHNMNTTALISVEPGVEELVVDCRGTVDTADNAGIIGRHAGHLPRWHFMGQSPLTRPGAQMKALAAKCAGETDELAKMHALSQAVLEAVAYETGMTDSATKAEEALVAGSGVCQDHAQIFIGCARHLGVAARYVSGYLMMDDRTQQDAGHAWAEAHVEGVGWIGFDISNQICPDERYIRVATGCDYSEAAPVTGISIGAKSDSLKVELDVSQQSQSQSQSQAQQSQSQSQHQTSGGDKGQGG